MYECRLIDFNQLEELLILTALNNGKGLIIEIFRNPRLHFGFPELLGKVGRYHTICNDLVRAARRLPCFEILSVQTVTPLLAVQPRQLLKEDKHLVEAVCDRLTINKPWRVTQVIAERDKIPSNAAQELMAQRFSALPGQCKIHAEIQLALYYLREEGRKVRPRVVAASKSACFPV